MPRIREDSRLMRTHESPKPILQSDTAPKSPNKSGSDEIGLQEKKEPKVKTGRLRGGYKQLCEILERNNWDSVVDLLFKRKEDSCILDALNSFGLEFGLPIMRALDAELSKDLIYSEDEEDEILPAEPEAPESEDGDKPKELAKEEKRAEKNKRKKLRKKERKREWKKEHSANDMSDNEELESKEEECKEEENMVEKTCEEMEQASPETSATLTETAATGVGNDDSETAEQASPESSLTVTETATTGEENDSGSDLHQVESNKEPDENLKEVDKDSLDVSTAGSLVKNQLDETPKLLDKSPKLEDKRKDDSSPVVHDPKEEKSVQEKAETEETKLKKDLQIVKQKIKPSKTSEDLKETHNIEGCREMEETSVPNPLLKETAVGGFSDNSGSNDDIVMTKEGGNLEPTERNTEVVAEHLAKKSTELAAVGNRFAACGQYEAAVKCYTDAIKYNPQEFKLFGNRSLCYERMRDYERALADARLALFMEPKWLKGLFRKGKALCGLKRYFEASLVYKEILEQDSSSAEAAQELKRAQTLHLMEMGFTWGQSSEALKNHPTLEEAIDALFGSEGRHRRSEEKSSLDTSGRRSQSAEHDVSQDKRNRLMEETKDEGKKRIAVGNNQPGIQQVNTPTPIDRARTKSQSPTPRDGVKTIRENCRENCDLWVGSLAPSVTKMKLYSIFGRAGTVSNVTMIANQQYAFVKYARKEDCDKAINMLNGMVVEGSPLLVRPSNKSRY